MRARNYLESSNTTVLAQRRNSCDSSFNMSPFTRLLFLGHDTLDNPTPYFGGRLRSRPCGKTLSPLRSLALCKIPG